MSDQCALGSLEQRSIQLDDTDQGREPQLTRLEDNVSGVHALEVVDLLLRHAEADLLTVLVCDPVQIIQAEEPIPEQRFVLRLHRSRFLR
ncbi:hypothetical protein D3C76_1087400 [compost metagenome]